MLTRRQVLVLLAVLVFINICIIVNILRNNNKDPVLVVPTFVPANTEYVINNPTLCELSPGEKEVQILMIVISHAGNVDTRKALRRHYPREELRGLGIRRIFMLGVPLEGEHDSVTRTFNNSISQNEILAENKEHFDIIQGDFIESYRNLTLKLVMGMRWILSYCSSARYIAKIDDDWVVDLHRLFDVLGATHLDEAPRIAGFTYLSSDVRREVYDEKYYVPHEEFSSDHYPTYVCGNFYLTTPQTVRLLLAVVHSTPYIRMEDVYMTGLLRKSAMVDIISLCWEARGEFNRVEHHCLRQDSFKTFQCRYLIMDLNIVGKKAIPWFKEHTEYCYKNACPPKSMLDPCTRYWR